MYRDHAINRGLFRWESQSTQAPNQPRVRRWIEHQDRGGGILLFVRDKRRWELGTRPFTFLGPATYVDLRSDLTLDVVHRVLQTVFGWTDTHLWRFSLGGDPFSRAGQAFLCPWDVEEGGFEDDGALPASEVRLDETMQDAGDVLYYVYDYGDNWDLTLRLEAVSARAADCPSAILVGGRRAAPPEDCGGITDGAEFAEILKDPETLDIDAINAGLRSPYIALTEHNLDRRLVDLIDGWSTARSEKTSRDGRWPC